MRNIFLIVFSKFSVLSLSENVLFSCYTCGVATLDLTLTIFEVTGTPLLDFG